jgi:hypothetical protein
VAILNKQEGSQVDMHSKTPLGEFLLFSHLFSKDTLSSTNFYQGESFARIKKDAFGQG